MQKVPYCYKSVQRFRVTCLFTSQYDTREYGTIAGVKYNNGTAILVILALISNLIQFPSF